MSKRDIIKNENNIENLIPNFYIENLKKIPKNRAVAIFMRHAERFKIEKGELGLEVPLTENGRKSAFLLGKNYIKENLVGLYSSPVGRCIDTGENIILGANKEIKIIEDSTLGGKDIFMNDFSLFALAYMKFGMPAILDKVYNHEEVPGLNKIEESIPLFIKHILSKITNSGVTLFISHDSFISFIASEIFRHRTTVDDWPNFMEPIFIWKEENYIKLLFRDLEKKIELNL